MEKKIIAKGEQKDTRGTKTKDSRTGLTSPARLCPSLSANSGFTDSLNFLFILRLGSSYIFQIKLPRSAGNLPQISFTPWLQIELG